MPTNTLDRSLPMDIEAERSILGAILLNNAALDSVARLLIPSQFFHAHHKRIYESMLRLAEDQTPIDLVMVCSELQRAGDLENAGGAAYISQLMDGVPNISNVEHYARIVKEKSLLRGLVHAAETIQRTAIAAESSAEEILDRAERSITEIGEGRALTELLPLSEIVADNLHDLRQVLTSKHAITGLSTGYLQLDTLLCGLQPGNVVVLAARPSVGKTALALNIASNVARSGIRAALFSLEMSKREILQRLVSSIWRRDMRKLRGGGMLPEDWAVLTRQLAEMSQLPLYIDDANPTTVTEMAAKARYVKRRDGLGLVIVDYLQLVSGATRGRYANRNEEVGATSRGLKAMARTLDVPVIVLSQLTRASEKEDRRPQLSDLRESGAIEQDADVVMFIHRPNAFKVGASTEDRAESEVVVAKQRNGPTESVRFVFFGPYTRFEERAPELSYE